MWRRIAWWQRWCSQRLRRASLIIGCPSSCVSVCRWARVRVPLGKGNRSVMGYCVALETGKPITTRLKELKSIVDDPALVSGEILQLVQWMADYYVAELGQVLETVVPASVRGKAGTREKLFLHVPTRRGSSADAARVAAQTGPDHALPGGVPTAADAGRDHPGRGLYHRSDQEAA